MDNKEFDIQLTGIGVSSQLETMAAKWGLHLCEAPESFPVLEVQREVAENVSFDWNYLFRVLRRHLVAKKENPLCFFHLPVDGDSPRDKLFVPGESGEILPADEAWIDGGVKSGVRFWPINSTRDDQFVWLPQFSSSPLSVPGKSWALFLDRDGILNRDRGYVSSVGDLVWNEDIFPIISRAREHGYEIVILTNQSGIARGAYELEEMTVLHRHMDRVIRERTGVEVLAWYYCPYHSDVDSSIYGYSSILRKPLPGMLLRACAEYSLDLTRSAMLGDKKTDRFRGVDLATWLLESEYLDSSEAKSYFRSHDWQNAIPPNYVSSLKEFCERFFSRKR